VGHKDSDERFHFWEHDKKKKSTSQAELYTISTLTMDPVRTIAVVPQGSTHRYWKAIHAGVNKAAHDLAVRGVAVRVTWKGPWREGNHGEQIQIVRGFIKSGVQGMVLGPFDSVALVAPVEEAASAGIPTLIIDSALDSRQIVSFIGSDNEQAGAMAADHMAGLLGRKGRVLLLRYEKGSASTNERAKGFLDRLKQGHPGITVVSPDHYAGTTRDTARQASTDLLGMHGDEIQGIFTLNESSTAGMLMALQNVKKAGKIVLIGFDSSDVYLDAMRYKQLHGLVVQDPFRMGELAIKTLVDHLEGKPVQKRIATPVMVVTPENIDQSEAKLLLHPPLDQYLPDSRS
jgi:ribose transport system substrate-binding protein